MDEIVVFVAADTVTYLVSWEALTVGGDDGECGASRGALVCRREAGHPGPHQAAERRPKPAGFRLT